MLMWKRILLDFIIGGVMVASALLIASFIGPVYGGVLAGAPIRAGTTAVLAGVRGGIEAAEGVAEGILFSMVANVFFALILVLALPKIGLWRGMTLASAVFLITVIILMRITP